MDRRNQDLRDMNNAIRAKQALGAANAAAMRKQFQQVVAEQHRVKAAVRKQNDAMDSLSNQGSELRVGEITFGPVTAGPTSIRRP